MRRGCCICNKSAGIGLVSVPVVGTEDAKDKEGIASLVERRKRILKDYKDRLKLYFCLPYPRARAGSHANGESPKP